MVKIEGTLATVRFHQSNFLIGILDNNITVKGNMLSPQLGMEYTFTGDWERHPKFGRQFAFTDYQHSFPTSLAAIKAYLAENCKWIGPVISRRLIDTYGENTLRVCKNGPDKVARDISGLTFKRAQEISAKLRDNEENEKLQLELKEIFGGVRVSKRVVGEIISRWREGAVTKIRENPYVLISDFKGIGFLTADNIARKVGYDVNGSPRVRAGLAHVLKEQAFGHGHVCLPRGELIHYTEKILGLSHKRIDDEIAAMVVDGILVAVGKFVYLRKYYEDEVLIADKLKMLARQEVVVVGSPDFTRLMDDQKEALQEIVKTGLFILSGSPGTGKSHLIKHIINSFPGKRIKLAAPTGKASKRMYELTGKQAMTIHKLLEPERVDDGSGKLKFRFTRDSSNPIEADLIILDELSMVDTSLMASFLNAVAPGTQLIFVGDFYQLPSVGPGNILKDMIASGVIPCKELTIIKRQDAGMIITNSHRIKAGKDIEVKNSTAKDFFFLSRDKQEDIQKLIVELVAQKLPQAYRVDALRDIQVITALRERSLLSCKALNKELQAKLNKNPAIEKCKFRVGDKVIQTKNRYDLGIINGDIGYVLRISKPDREMEIEFEAPKRTVSVPLYNNEIELAYALTVHKYQGSEAPIIVIPIHKALGPFVTQRNWIYTGISRAQKVCICVGQRSEITRIIKRNKQQLRYTGLLRMLKEKS